MSNLCRLSAVVFLCASGCVTRDTPSALSEGCLLNSDCEAPLVCVFRRCHTTCAADRDCPANSRCQITDNPYAVCLLDDENNCANRACPPGLTCGPDKRCRRDCLTKRDCLDEQECLEGQCVAPQDKGPSGLEPTVGLCTFDADCKELADRSGTFLQCAPDHRCRPQCEDTANCRLGEACQAGRCVRTDAGVNAACQLDAQCPAPQLCRSGRCVTECTRDQDCSTGLVCSAQARCVAPAGDGGAGSGCARSSDCGPGLVCLGGACRVECVEARDCAVGLACVASRCVLPAADGGVGATCARSSECGPGLLCVGGRCGPECQDSRDCSAGDTCVLNRCQAPQPTADGGVGAVCVYASQCRAPLSCLAGRCAPACQDTVDCAPGLVCELQVCKVPLVDGGATDAGTSTDAGRPCAYTSQCAPGERCLGGQCGPECAGDRDCAAPLVCSQPGGGRCVVPDGGVLCQRASDCAAGQRCSPQGLCVPECVSGVDCAAGLACVGQRCVPAGGSADGGPTGWGTPCAFPSTCAPFGLTCGVSGFCVYQCVADADCPTTAGFCCRTNRCVAGGACVVPTDGGAGADAGGAPPDGGCRSDLDCLDNDFCNGSERCVLGTCRAGRSPCDDDNPCTIDSCSNALRTCSFQTQAIDVDGDQHYPLACGGTADDCDDHDAFTFPGALERCDWKDNNCNGGVDEGLWVEEPGARGAVTTSGVYPGLAGAPAAVKLGSEVLVTAASFGINGRHELFKLSAADLTFVTGPIPVSGAATAWTACTTFNGRQAVHPGLASNGSVALAHGFTQSFASTPLYCCNNAINANPLDRRSQRNFGTLVTPAPFSAAAFAFTEFDDQFNPSDSSLCSGFSNFFQQPRMTPVNAAWSPVLGAFVGTWFEQPNLYQSLSNTNTTRLRFTTLGLDGGVATPRNVYAGLGLDAVMKYANAQSAGLPRVAVGASTVLFAWSNYEMPPLNEVRVRYVLYDAALTSIVAGPFELNLGSGFQRIDWATFDGTYYRLVGYGGINAPDERTKLLTMTEAGAILSSRPLGVPSPNSQQPEYHSNSQSSSALLGAQGQGFVHAIVQDQRLRFFWGASAPDAGAFQSVDFLLGGDPTDHSDFTVVPLSDTRVGVLWTDGDLRRTVMKCGP